MKRFVSVLTLAVYCLQLGVSCGLTAGSEDERSPSEPVAQGRALTGDEELPAPGEVLTRSELDGDGYVPGTVAGSFGVTPDGAATYHVPLWVPPGRAGVQPSLSLNYNSRAGNGLLGVGWSVGGLSQITRCNKTLAQDGAPGAVSFDASDALCLDGKRLVQVGGFNGGDKSYTTEIEAFSHILARQEDGKGPLWFEVQLKNGMVLEYGREYASRIEGHRMRYVPASLNATDATVVGQHDTETVRYGWSLSKVRDRHGNYMTVEYELRVHGDASSGFAYEQLPVMMRYTGSTTDASVATPRRSVRFYYRGAERADPIEHHVSGFKLRNVRLLDTLEMWGPGWEVAPLRAYRFFYRNDSISGRSLLEKLQECDAMGLCKRPTVFNWELAQAGAGRVILPSDQYFERVVTPSWSPGVRDRKDAPDSKGYPSAADFWTLQALDINGDGRDDIMYRVSPLVNGRIERPIWYYRLNVDGRSFGQSTELPTLPRATLGDGSDDLRTVDLNNDGKVDIIGLYLADADTGSSGRYQFFLSNGAGFTETQADTSDFWFDQASPARVPAMHVADLNGDGLPDVARSLRGWNVPDEWGVRLTQVDAAGTPSYPAQHQRTGVAAGLDHAGYAVDVDGDGAMELLVREPEHGTSDNYSRFLVALGRTPSGAIGKKFTTTLSTLPVPGSNNPYIYRHHWFMDINGDGLPDSVSAKSQRMGLDTGGHLEIAINTGNGFSPPVTQLLPDGAQVSFSKRNTEHRFTDVGVRVMDFNLDGKQDLLLTDGGNGVGVRTHLVVLESTGTNFRVRTLAIPVGVTTGLGDELHVSVGSLEEEDNPPPSYKGSGWGMKQTQLLDANGDGLTDIIQVERQLVSGLEQWIPVLYLRNSFKPDMLKSVDDGLGNRTAVTYEATTYRSPSQQANHHTPATCTYPQSCNLRAQWLVTSHLEPNGIWEVRRFKYTYSGGRTDLRGRGWLGFASRTVEDVQGNRKSTSYYDNTQRTLGFYLGAHRPKEEVTTVTLAGGQVDTFKRNFEYLYQSKANGKVIFPYVWKTTLSEVDGQYGELRRRVVTDTYDDYGNLTRREESTKDGHLTVLSATYDNFPDEGDYLLGLLRRQTVTSTTPAGQSVTRTKEYQYCDGASCRPTSHQLRREIVEPDAVSPEREDVWLQTTYLYNVLGLVTHATSTDTAGRERGAELKYESYERLLPSARIFYPTDDPGGPVLRTDYAYHKGMGLLSLQQDPNGIQTRWYYDSFGRPRAEDGPDSGDTTLSYTVENEKPLITTREVDVATCGWSAYGRDFSSCTRNGAEAQVRYDELGREELRRARGFDGQWTQTYTQYDELGRVSTVTEPRTEMGPVINRHFEYDNRDRVRFVRNPDGSYRETQYQGLKTLGWDEKRNHSYTVADELGRIVQSTDINSTGPILTQYEYGPFGLPRFITDAHNNLTEMEYDRLGRRTVLNDPDSGISRTWYYAFGDTRTQTDGKGNTLQYTYDGVGRQLTETNQPPATGSLPEVTSFVWDTAPNGLGLLHTATSPDGVVQTYEYDTLSRPNHERWNIQGQEYLLSSTYDAQGRLQTLGYPEVAGRSRMGVLYNYTTYGQLKSVQNVLSGHTYWTATARNASGLLTGESFGNGVSSLRRYDALNQLRFIDTTGPGGAVQSLAYDYEANGNLHSRIDRVAQVTEDFQYDGVDRLKQWNVYKGCNSAVFTYDYDALGNLKYRSSKLGTAANAPFEEVVYSYGDGTAGPHAVTSTVTSAGTDNYAYDGNGNLNQRQEVTAGLRELDYTSFNLPKRVTQAGGQWNFGYDANQRRAFKQSSDGHSTVYVGGMYEKRTNPDGSTAHFFMVLGAEGVVAQVEWTDVPTPGAEAVAYLHTDNLGSVESVTGHGGAVLERRKHDPFGLRKNAANPALDYSGDTSNLRQGFTGHEHDEEMGLINMKGRMYDPKLGRFLSPDPIVQAPFFGQSLNRYSYVFNNPLTWTDPTGFVADPEPMPKGPMEYIVFTEDEEVIGDKKTSSPPVVSTPEKPGSSPEKPESSSSEKAVNEFWQSGTGAGVEPVVGSADQNGSRASGLEAVAYAAEGLAVGAGFGVGTMYVLGALSAIYFPLAVVVGGGLAAYGVYQLATGGAQALWESAERIGGGRGTAGDYFNMGALVGGFASGRFAKPTLQQGQAHGAWLKNTVLSYVRAGRLDALSKAAGVAKDGGLLTEAGRALEKHGSRAGSRYPKATGSAANKSKQGQQIVNEILYSPGATMKNRHHARYGYVTEVRAPDGRGVRFSRDDGHFIGFLE